MNGRVRVSLALLGLGPVVGPTLACNLGGASAPPSPTVTQIAPPHTLAATSHPVPTTEVPAEIMLVSGQVLTVDVMDPVSQAVAIKGNVILDVGSRPRCCPTGARFQS